jgi:hypothetical protein
MKYDTVTRKQSAPIWLVVFMMLLLPSCVGDRVFVISGTVVDENGNPIQGAKITVRDENRHVEATFSTDETGQFFYEISQPLRSAFIARQKGLIHTRQVMS